MRGFDFRYILNGFVDSYLYSIGLLDTALPFEELRPRSRINGAAEAADNSPDFWQRIRAAVPPRPNPAVVTQERLALGQRPPLLQHSKNPIAGARRRQMF